MKYRFRVSRSKDTVSPCRRLAPPPKHRIYRLRGKNTPRPLSAERIRLCDLFEIGMLPAPESPPQKRLKRNILSNLYTAAKTIACAIPKGIQRVGRILRAWARSVFSHPRTPRPEKRIHAVPVLCGILCASLLVTSLSVCGILAVFFLPYHRPHTSVTIPNFVGSAVPPQDPSSIRIMVEYEYNPLVSAGTVIAQSPMAGVTRRVYGSDGFCTVLLRVSKERDTYRLEELSGRTRRDALLILANHKIQSTVVEEFSDTVPSGTVLSTMPAAGQELREGATVILRISKGRQIQTVRVPNLLGLTESAANSLLHSGGFQVGSVTYRSSSSPSGTIINQTPTDHAEVEKGATVSYTVSTGSLYDTKTLPDLYGMTQSEAALALREYGLVIGSCFPVASAAPKGTVIAQFPLPDTPITSSTVSVDLYLSS